jgi:outer membrane protein assembly factor BamE (lipoprotein component of BamABCDE complex)
VIPEERLEQIPIGASQEQVLILMAPLDGTTVSGEVFYYIHNAPRPVAFMRNPWSISASSRFTSTRIGACSNANYGMRDGRIFDYVSRTTPSGGEEINYLGSIFKAFSF